MTKSEAWQEYKRAAREGRRLLSKLRRAPLVKREIVAAAESQVNLEVRAAWPMPAQSDETEQLAA